MPDYLIEHDTLYRYGAPVSESWQLARLVPRELPWQRLLWHRLDIDPVPGECETRVDAWGNTVAGFALHGAHESLSVRMRCEVALGERPLPPPGASLPWEAVREHAGGRGPFEDLSPAALRLPTPRLPWSDAAHAYAAQSLAPGRDWLEAVTELMRRIHRDFRFEAGVTDVGTPVDEVLARRCGVCQDFAHLMIAGLRAHGLPARYMSGYLLTNPPPGKPRLAGADASHAWVAAHAPGLGWVEFDPTNDCLADERFVTLGWGGDFTDVAPLRGVIRGGGEQQMQVRVTVWPVGNQHEEFAAVYHR
ncbi:transglutaminase family protein [Caldimonas tepidiphila]|uniref:transglutaminase family protein n=1 Tax=Caldimonas tepidiphila TaxID=2315841 RepID=UPI000E5AD2CE|nr:transglutaminase family protein [Caldimonas tepidiphila]